MSDLHLEFGSLDLEPVGEDVLVLAGDVGLGAASARWAVSYASRTKVPVVMIAGNHEFYRQPSIRSTFDALRAVANAEPLLTFLDDDVATVAGVTFVGSTLWTDYDLYGSVFRPSAMAYARRAMNDHCAISEDEGPFTPEYARRRHEFSVGILREYLPRRYPEGPVVVVTHHLPSARSIDERYADHPLNPAFASNLDDLVADSAAALWVHGHTHRSADHQIGETRVLCNPRGYPHELNSAFDPDFVVEV